MRFSLWLVKVALFLLVLSFAVKNTDVVAVRYYLGYQWQAPLVLVLLAFFCLGVLVGIAAGLGQMLRQRREIAALRRDAGGRRRAEQPAVPPGDAPGVA